MGTAVAISPRGLLLTNAHVVEGSRRVLLFNELEEAWPARVLVRDERADLALLKVERQVMPTALPLSDSRSLRPGEWVAALGHSYRGRTAVTFGSFIGLETGVRNGGGEDREYLVASLRMRPGYSGGPLVDAKGNLVGLNAMITGPEVGVAIPSNVVRGFLRRALVEEVQGI
jgi:serine protease Do